jgi:hypothetical protein
MKSFAIFIKSVLLLEIFAISLLFLAGAGLTWVERGYRSNETFFSYRIQHIDCLPAWFVAALFIMAVNGIWMFRLAYVDGTFRTPRDRPLGEWGISIPIHPLRLFAVNLVMIPATLMLFLIIRAYYW